MNFLDRLANRYKTAPDQIAVRFYRGAEHSIADLLEAASGAAHRLKEIEEIPGKPVLIFAPFGFDGMVLFIAAMIARAVPAFMPLPSDRQNPEVFWAHHRSLFRHIAGGILLLPRNLIDQVQSYCPDNPLQILALEDCTGDAAPPHPFDVPESGNNTIAFLQHSSGTTGVKKGVMLSHDQIDLQIKACAQSLDLGPKDRIVSWLPLYHDMGLIACFVLPLALGIEVTYLDPFRWVARPHSLFDAIGRHRGTLVWLPNFAFRHLVRAVPASGGSFDLSSIRAFVNCSEPCLNETLEEFVRTFEPMGVHAGQMSCSYAMAETVFSVSQTPPGQPVMKVEVDRDALAMDGACLYPHKGTRQRQWLASSGRPLNGVEIRVIDEKGKAVADGCCGAIQIRCPFMFTGYFRDQAKTTRAFDGDWYITRDRGFLHQGEVFVLGRIDDLIISNGRNFHAHEIEQIVSGIPGVISGRVAAFGHFSRTAGSHVLVILAETDFDRANQDSSSITRMISQRVFDVLNISPHDVVMLPPKTVIKTTSGKIHRTANKQLYEEGKLKSWNQPD